MGQDKRWPARPANVVGQCVLLLRCGGALVVLQLIKDGDGEDVVVELLQLGALDQVGADADFEVLPRNVGGQGVFYT